MRWISLNLLWNTHTSLSNIVSNRGWFDAAMREYAIEWGKRAFRKNWNIWKLCVVYNLINLQLMCALCALDWGARRARSSPQQRSAAASSIAVIILKNKSADLVTLWLSIIVCFTHTRQGKSCCPSEVGVATRVILTGNTQRWLGREEQCGYEDKHENCLINWK